MSEVKRINIESDLYEYMSIEEDNRKIENTLKKEARKEGLEEGRTLGISLGRAEGRAEIIKKLLANNMSKEDISKITGIDIKELEKMQRQVDDNK